MKKLLIMMAMAVGFTAFAAANDPLIRTDVEKGASYDVLCKGEKVFSFMSNETGSVNVQGVAAKSMNAGDYAVVKSTAPADGEGSDSGVVNGDESKAAELTQFITHGNTYADGAVILEGERYMMVEVKDGESFGGFDWDLSLKKTDVNRNAFLLDGAQNGGANFDLSVLQAAEAGWHYEVILVDSRGADGQLVKDGVAGGSKWISGWCAFAAQEGKDEASQLGWHKVQIGESGVFDVEKQTPYFEQDPSPFVAPGYAAIYNLLKLGFWTVFPLPTAYTKVLDSTQTLTLDENYEHLNKSVLPPKTTFDLDVAYSFCAFADNAERDIVLKALEGVDFTKMGNPGSPSYAATLAFHEKVLQGTFFEDPDWASSNEVLRAWYVRTMPYLQWNADFEVSFDRLVKANSVVLAGSYEQAKDFEGDTGYDFKNWVGDCPRKDMAAGEKYRLLASNETASVTLNYQEVCKRVQEFLCGVCNFSFENWGTTMRVDLKLYENTGRCNEKAGGVQAIVGTYKYTFKGPLNVKFYENEEELENLAIKTNHDGTCEIPLPALKGDDKTAFVGWSNRVNDVIYTNSLPARTWTPGGTCLDLYATWKAAQIVVVSNETAQIKDQNIKVTDDWVKDVLKIEPTEKETVQEKLNEPVGNDTEKGTLKKWEAYVLGLDATDPNAVVKVDQTAGAQEDKAIVLSTVQAPPPDSGFKVAYSLDKVEDNEKTVQKTVDKRDTNDLTIDLEPQDDTPTGYYKMNVIVTPDNADPIKYPAENTIGVLKVESEEKLLPVAVPWLSLEAGTEVTPDEIVDPRTLSENDQIHVWQESVGGQQNIYTSWHVENGKWVVNPTVKVNPDMSVNMLTAAQAREGSVERGKGVWLERKDTTKPFYLVGQYKQEEKASVQINAPKDGVKAEYNLIAPTGIEETDLNEVITKDIGETDKLMIVNKGLPTYYSFSGGKWGYNKQVLTTTASGRVGIRVVRETEAKVPAGIGLWYISEGGKPTINWNK